MHQLCSDRLNYSWEALEDYGAILWEKIFDYGNGYLPEAQEKIISIFTQPWVMPEY